MVGLLRDSLRKLAVNHSYNIEVVVHKKVFRSQIYVNGGGGGISPAVGVNREVFSTMSMTVSMATLVGQALVFVWSRRHVMTGRYPWRRGPQMLVPNNS